MMKILAVGAHFDDVELGCGGALAKHHALGDTVFIYVSTISGYSDYKSNTVRGMENALLEGKKAAEILGAKLITGSFQTCRLEFQEELNIEILKIIEQENIDIMYTHWCADVHHDHHALAMASLHSGRHVKRILLYRSNWYHSFVDFRGNFYVDITDTWEKKEGAIKAHASEYHRVGDKWLSFFRNEAENAGQKIGCRLAEVFEVVKWIM